MQCFDKNCESKYDKIIEYIFCHLQSFVVSLLFSVVKHARCFKWGSKLDLFYSSRKSYHRTIIPHSVSEGISSYLYILVGNYCRGRPKRLPFQKLRGIGEAATHFPELLSFTLDPYLIMLDVKQERIKYHFLNFFVWHDQGLNPGLQGHWRRFNPLGQWVGYIYAYRRPECSVHKMNLAFTNRTLHNGERVHQCPGRHWFNPRSSQNKDLKLKLDASLLDSQH